MIPILFDADARDFNNRGLGPLNDCISCKVVEERNSTYELEMQYPKDGIHFSEIGLNKIIYAIPSPYRMPQPFRIYKISREMRGSVTINAQHISYDLSGITVMPFTAGSLADVFYGIKTNSINENIFTFFGSSALSCTCTYEKPNSARQILGGMEGSALDIFGGEYEFDKFEVIWRQNRGANNGVTVRYGKNLMDVKQEIDASGVVTGAVPYWIDSESGTVVIGSRIDVAGEFPIERIVPLDLSEKFDNMPTQSELNKAAKSYVESNYTGEPDINCDITFALIEQYEEYKDFALLEKCDLCDIVTVVYPELGVHSTAKIVKIETDVLRERYDSVTIGSVRANIAQTIVAQQKEVDNVPSRMDVSQLVRSSLDKITGAQGGAVRLLDTNDDGLPDTLYIADNPDPSKAIQVWRFNYLGWGASKNGYNGPFTLGATLEKGLLAEFVTAAKLVAGTITSADNESFLLDLDNSILHMKSQSVLIDDKSFGDIAGDSAQTAINNFISNVYDPRIADLQRQIDGQIETFFYDYPPTLNNEPALSWESDTDKSKHEGDLFFDKTTGYAYRFYKDGNIWEWVQVRDNDITTALQEAAAAQDTADAKRRVFVSTPKPPYDVGDLWVQGANGDILRCGTNRESGEYDPDDWVRASKYTDDSSLNTFIKGEFQRTIDDIKKQNDGKAETWYQSANPSDAWPSDEIKKEHTGDMWYNTSNSNYYRWNGTTWDIMEINPPDDVFDIIDGKAQIFIDTPTVPYRVGDLWFNSSTSDIMTCIYDRLEGEYNPTDWEKRNKYTDDTTANNVQSTLSTEIDVVAGEVSAKVSRDDLEAYIRLRPDGVHVGRINTSVEAFVNASGSFDITENEKVVSSFGNRRQQLGTLIIYQTNDGGHAFKTLTQGGQ